MVGPKIEVYCGLDGAWVVQIDTTFEPDGTDGGPGLRVYINDDDAYIGREEEATS